MRKKMLVLFAITLFFGTLLVFTPNVSACHDCIVTCSPSTEQDITDDTTYTVEYEIRMRLSPGCGDTYHVGFTASDAPIGWSRKVYEKGDATKTDLLESDPPPFRKWRSRRGTVTRWPV